MIAFYKSSDGLDLAYRDTGRTHGALPLLCLSGYSRNGTDFQYLMPHIPADIRVIRPDFRGRGASDWADRHSYTVPQETDDILRLMDHLNIDKAAVLGTSRGGLVAMGMAAAAKDRLLGICLNDIGPEVDEAGRDQIATYLGHRPPYATRAQAAAERGAQMPGFHNVPPERWRQEVATHYGQSDRGLELTYDPDLRLSYEEMRGVEIDLWPYFDGFNGLPLALIRGANSKLLTAIAADKMRARRPDMLFAEVPDRAHVPFLDEPQALEVIHAWLSMLPRP